MININNILITVCFLNFKILHLCSRVDVLPPKDSIVQSHRRIIIDKLKDLQTCHVGRLQDCPAFCLIEIRWHCDNGVFYGLLYKRETNTELEATVQIFSSTMCLFYSKYSLYLQSLEPNHECSSTPCPKVPLECTACLWTEKSV